MSAAICGNFRTLWFLLPHIQSKNLKIKIYRNIILPVVLYGCETWSLILREESRLRVIENGVLRVFGPKRDEVTGEWRILHKELRDLYSLLYIVRVVKSRRMRWAGHVARMGEERGVHRVLVGKPEGKGPLGRPRYRFFYLSPRMQRSVRGHSAAVLMGNGSDMQAIYLVMYRL